MFVELPQIPIARSNKPSDPPRQSTYRDRPAKPLLDQFAHGVRMVNFSIRPFQYSAIFVRVQLPGTPAKCPVKIHAACLTLFLPVEVTTSTLSAIIDRQMAAERPPFDPGQYTGLHFIKRNAFRLADLPGWNGAASRNQQGACQAQ